MQENLPEFILKNQEKLIRSLSKFPRQLVEDAISVILIRLVQNPREVADNWNWSRLALRNTCVNLLNKKEEAILQLTQFDENDNNYTIDSYADDFDLIEKTIEFQENRLEINKLNSLINEELTPHQKKAVDMFLKTGEHIDENHKVLYAKAKRRLIDVKNNPTKSKRFKSYYAKFPHEGTKVSPENYKKKGRCGRKPSIDSEVRENIFKELKLNSKGYNFKELSQKYNVSKSFLRKLLQKNGISFTQLKELV